MAVVIRMKKTGRRNRPCYRISVADKRWPRDGRTLETLGLYDPIAKRTEAQITLNVESAKRWLANGALPSETVRSIFKRHGVYEGVAIRSPRKRQRKLTTKTHMRKTAAKAARAEAKSARHAARCAAKKAAAAPAGA